MNRSKIFIHLGTCYTGGFTTTAPAESMNNLLKAMGNYRLHQLSVPEFVEHTLKFVEFIEKKEVQGQLSLINKPTSINPGNIYPLQVMFLEIKAKISDHGFGLLSNEASLTSNFFVYKIEQEDWASIGSLCTNTLKSDQRDEGPISAMSQPARVKFLLARTGIDDQLTLDLKDPSKIMGVFLVDDRTAKNSNIFVYFKNHTVKCNCKLLRQLGIFCRHGFSTLLHQNGYEVAFFHVLLVNIHLHRDRDLYLNLDPAVALYTPVHNFSSFGQSLTAEDKTHFIQPYTTLFKRWETNAQAYTDIAPKADDQPSADLRLKRANEAHTLMSQMTASNQIKTLQFMSSVVKPSYPEGFSHHVDYHTKPGTTTLSNTSFPSQFQPTTFKTNGSKKTAAQVFVSHHLNADKTGKILKADIVPGVLTGEKSGTATSSQPRSLGALSAKHIHHKNHLGEGYDHLQFGTDEIRTDSKLQIPDERSLKSPSPLLSAINLEFETGAQVSNAVTGEIGKRRKLDVNDISGGTFSSLEFIPFSLPASHHNTRSATARNRTAAVNSGTKFGIQAGKKEEAIIVDDEYEKLSSDGQNKSQPHRHNTRSSDQFEQEIVFSCPMVTLSVSDMQIYN